MPGIDTLLAVADAYAAAEGVSEKTVSKRALDDSSRLGELRAGGCDIGVRRLERTLRWFSDNWPDAPWPVAGGERPIPTTRSANVDPVIAGAAA